MNYFDLLDDDTGVVNGNTLSDLKDYIEASTLDYEDDNIIHYTYCPASMLKELFNLSDDEIFELVLPLGYHICQLFGDCEYESEDYYIVKDEESVNKLISDCENYLDFTPSYEIIPNVAYDECLKEAKNKEKPTKNQLKDWAKKHKKSDKKNAWGWWVFPNVEGSINFFNRAMGSTSASGAEASGNLTGTSTGTSSAGSTSAGVGESLTVHSNYSSYAEVQKEYESTKFTNRAIQRMDDAIEKYKNLENLKLMNNQDNPICYESAVNNVFYFNKLGKDCTLHLGTFDETGTQIVHAWVECDGEIYQTREPKDKPKNYKLVSLKEIKIPKEFTKDEIEKAIKSSYQTLDEALNESKEDIEKFINKFGEDTYKWFLKSKDRLKNNKISTDILYHVKNTSVEDMQNILHNLQSKVKSDDLTKIQGKYNYLGEKDGYKVYQPLDSLASMNLGVGSGWCTTGRYCHYGDANFKPSLKDAEKHWNDYTGQGVKFYYLLDAKTMLAKYTIAVFPETLYVKQFIENYYIEETNFEIYNAEDNIDYTAYFELKNILELIPEKLIFKAEELKNITAEVVDGVVVPSTKYKFSKSITIPKGVTRIEDKAFSDCTGLKEIIIPDGVTSIGEFAFSSCKNLTKITIPGSIVDIGSYAFLYCKSLTKITIPEGIKSIGRGAFHDCYDLTTITIPNSMERIEVSTFKGCVSLAKITIPKGITSIGDFAFADCSALTEVIIPDSVVEMGINVFYGCKKLTIYCEAEEQPKYWNVKWNTRCPVVWDYRNKKTESLNEKIESHETLNPKFWQGEELKQEVEDKIKVITDRFVEYLNNRDIKIDIKDILLLGSNASYNYTDDSDLDIHIIVEPKEIAEDEELLKQLYDLAASAFNDKFNIQLKGADAEVYVELNDTNANSNGIYSINKGWLKKPKKENVAGIELDEVEFEKWEDRYNDLLVSHDKNEIKQFIDDLYKLRKDSILKDGEYGQGNLIFKEMRNLNYIKNIKNLLDMIESEEMSLESVNK